MSQAEQYARDVTKGKIIAGRLIHLACERFLKDLQRDDIFFDQSEADKIVLFAERYCCLWEDKWRGQPVKIMPWMAFILQQIYGWIKKEDGLRRVRKVYVQIAKKNAKSTIAAIVANFHLFADERIKTPAIYVGSNNEMQSRICVNITGKIVEQSPELYELVEDGTVDLFKYKENIISVVHRERDGFIKALSKETGSKTDKQAGGKHGINCSLGVIDEYAMADSDSLLNTLESSQAAREEPLIFCITTAGHKQNGPCYQQLRRTGLDILEGISQDDSYLAFIYEHDKGDDISDEKVWPKSNPNIGISVFPDFLRARLMAAKNEGGSKLIDVSTFNFDEWMDTPEVWIPAEVFAANNYGSSIDELEGLECFGGLTIISSLELNAFILLFPNFKTISGKSITAIKCLFWMPEGDLAENKTKMDLSRWAQEGFIETCTGTVIDNDFIYNIISKDLQKYNLHSVALPVTLLSHDIVQRLVQDGVTFNPLSQGYNGISTPTKTWEEMLTAGLFETFANPVLAWMNKNAMALRKGEEIMIQKAGGKTSGITAGINALAQWKTIEAIPKHESVYLTRGVLVI